MMFVDSSVWFAAVFKRNRHNARAHEILKNGDMLLTTDLVAIETWSLISRRLHYDAAEGFCDGIQQGIASIERVLPVDFEAAWAIGQTFSDQQISLVDRTSLIRHPFNCPVRPAFASNSRTRGVIPRS